MLFLEGNKFPLLIFHLIFMSVRTFINAEKPIINATKRTQVMNNIVYRGKKITAVTCGKLSVKIMLNIKLYKK